MNTLIRAVRAVINGENFKTAIDEKTLALAEFHSLSPFLYPCMDGDATDEKIKEQVTSRHYVAVKRDVIQRAERAEAEAALSKAGIDFLPLKGMIIKSLYPSSYLRTMSDLDYLVNLQDFKKAKKVVEELGYKPELNREHHLEFVKPPIMVLELHRSLIPDVKVGGGALDNVMERCTRSQDNPHALEMSDEDFYLFLMFHLLKHRVNGGTGLRSYLDAYVFLKARPDLDRDYVNAAFAKTAYAEELAFIEKFSLDLFGGNQLDEDQTAALERTMRSGTYGLASTASQNDLNQADNSVLRVILRKLFPSVKVMKGWYPVLNKVIVLLPVLYVWHVLTRAFNVKNAITRVKALRKAKKAGKQKNEKV